MRTPRTPTPRTPLKGPVPRGRPAFSIKVQMDRTQIDKWTSRTPKQIDDALWDATPEIADVMIRHVRVYPPPIPTSKYQRTGDLGRGWWWGRFHKPNEVQINITNKMPYTKWVQDRRTQAAVHVGRWRTIQETNEATSHKAQAIWQRHLRKTVKT